MKKEGTMGYPIGHHAATESRSTAKSALGSLVTFRELDSERVRTYRLVGAGEADPDAGRISLASPLGRALVGRAPGETVRVLAPKGTRQLEILAVR
jgi:transcription elongation factor GreA